MFPLLLGAGFAGLFFLPFFAVKKVNDAGKVIAEHYGFQIRLMFMALVVAAVSTFNVVMTYMLTPPGFEAGGDMINSSFNELYATLFGMRHEFFVIAVLTWVLVLMQVLRIWIAARGNKTETSFKN